MMAPEDRCKAIDALVSQLAEFGDAVQVHVSWITDDQSTANYHSGRGNWYARRALADEFSVMDQARLTAHISRSVDHNRGE